MISVIDAEGKVADEQRSVLNLTMDDKNERKTMSHETDQLLKEAKAFLCASEICKEAPSEQHPQVHEVVNFDSLA